MTRASSKPLLAGIAALGMSFAGSAQVAKLPPEIPNGTRLLFRSRDSNAPIESIIVPKASLASTFRKLNDRDDIRFVAVDRRKYRHATPSDPLYVDQWYLQAAQPSAIAAASAWDITTGSAGTVVAVLDSGVRLDHPDLKRASQSGKILPGYDFVSGDGGSASQFLTANDGDGRDSDPSDPGDWIDGNDRQRSVFSTCTIENSSWHGTRVSGLIAAASDNANGIAGIGWQTLILPVRVMGKCGGYDIDILDGMRWAAGLHVDGVPDNPYPANIINISLGGDGICTDAYRDVIAEVMQRGAAVVVSAGNEGGPVVEPANCPGVIAVAGLRHVGTKVGYSNLGSEISISAPAGNCVNTFGACLFSLLTTYDLGRTVPTGPGFTDQFNTNLGTSFSAPLVSGVGALMHAVNPRLSPQQLTQRLMRSARPFPDGGQTPPPTCHVPVGPQDLQTDECVCTQTTCGAGMLYAPSAVAAALQPIVHIIPPSNVTSGALLRVDGSSSVAACNRSIASYSWTVESNQGNSASIPTTPTQATTEIAAPVTGSFTLRLTVTDDKGASDFGDVVITSTSATTLTIAPQNVAACPSAIVVPPESTPSPASTPPTAPPVSSGGGGGGALNEVLLLTLVLLALYRPRPSSSCRNS